jgi:outer membrane PBP1 activator LpoA protein
LAGGFSSSRATGCGSRLSSNSIASGASIEQRQTAGFVQEQQSRLALLLFVQGDRGRRAARALATSRMQALSGWRTPESPHRRPRL